MSRQRRAGCIASGCEREHLALGFCRHHYERNIHKYRKNALLHREEQRRYARKNKLKVTAHKKVRRAVMDGVLKKSPYCLNCGLISQFIEGHHADYSKPLEVLWLCKECHVKQHLKEKK